MENNNPAAILAQQLLKVKAVRLNPKEPFTWASGLKSPIYCDNRITLSHTEVRTFIRDEFVKSVNQYYGNPDVIAGVATGGIAQGALVAQVLNLPFVYVRSEKKNHGMNNQIEGEIKPGQKVVVIEDLVSTGKSSLAAVDALREADVEVVGMLAIFTYQMQVSAYNFASKQCELHTLTNYSTLIEEAIKENYISQNDLESLMEWRKDQQSWSDKFNV